MSSPPVPDRPRWQLASRACLAGGLLLLFVYACLYFALPQRRGEFTYLPALDPLPFAPMRGFTFEQALLHLGRFGLLGPALALLAIGIQGWFPRSGPDGGRVRGWAVLAGALSLLVSTVVMVEVLRGRPITDDELTYRYQATLFWEGRLGETGLPFWGPEAFTVAGRQGFTGKYLFGEPLVQIPGTLMDLPGIVHLPLAALTLLLWFRIVREDAGATTAAWATGFLALSPMFMLTNGTGLGHATAMTCLVLAGYGLVLGRGERPWLGALLAGNALGFGVAVRPQTVVPIGVVLGVALLVALWRRRRFGPLVLLGASALVWLVAVLLYDRAITGSALRLPWALWLPHEPFGFASAEGYTHNPGRALQNLLVSAIRLNGWWLGLPWGLLVVVLWLAVDRPTAGMKLWLLCGLALVAFNFLYYSPGVSDTGPVYYFELLLPGSWIAARATEAALERWPQMAWSLLAVHLSLGTGSFAAEQVDRLARLRHAICDRVDWALAQVEPPALLLHELAPQEAYNAGWVLSFPLRARGDFEPIVTYPRYDGQAAAALRRRYADRKCYYYRIDPRTWHPQLLRCEAAEDLLARPAPPGGLSRMYAPTAGLLGYLDD